MFPGSFQPSQLRGRGSFFYFLFLPSHCSRFIPLPGDTVFVNSPRYPVSYGETKLLLGVVVVASDLDPINVPSLRFPSCDEHLAMHLFDHGHFRFVLSSSFWG